MKLDYFLVCVAVGVGTYLFRYLPSRLGTSPGRAMRGPLGAFLASVGVASVAALLAASLEPFLVQALQPAGLAYAAAAVAGLFATYGAFRLSRSVALATLLGAAVFGVVTWLVGS